MRGRRPAARHRGFLAPSLPGDACCCRGFALVPLSKVRCSLDNTSRVFKPEMYASVSISVEARNVVSIPKSALLHLGESTVVFVELGETADKKTRYERRPVTVDETEGASFYPVLHGLEKGDRVVTVGAAQLAAML